MLIEMTIKGLMVDPITNMPIVLLKDKDGDRVLPIWVGIFEANAIALQIENIATPRPMTHDLLRNIINDLDGRVDRVVVRQVAHDGQVARRREPVEQLGERADWGVVRRDDTQVRLQKPDLLERELRHAERAAEQERRVGSVSTSVVLPLGPTAAEPHRRVRCAKCD